MKKRNQTIKALVEKANQYLAVDDDSVNAREGRQTLITFVSAMLMEANRYEGFNYTYWLEKGYQEWVAVGSPDYSYGTKDPYIYGPSGDKTKIRFY